jgi:hypothetical protein
LPLSEAATRFAIAATRPAQGGEGVSGEFGDESDGNETEPADEGVAKRRCLSRNFHSIESRSYLCSNAFLRSTSILMDVTLSIRIDVPAFTAASFVPL